MVETTVEVESDWTEEKFKNAVRQESAWGTVDYDGVTADPFGDVTTQASHRNVMAHSGEWPNPAIAHKVIPFVHEAPKETRGDFLPAQWLELADNATEAVKISAFLADSIIDKYPEIQPHIGMVHYVVDKVAEGFGFRIGLIENLAEHLLEDMGFEMPERTLKQVAKDEQQGIDIEVFGVDHSGYNVKYETNNSTGDGIKRIDVTSSENGYKITVEE